MEHQHLLFPRTWEGWEHPWVLLCQLASLGSFAEGHTAASGFGAGLSSLPRPHACKQPLGLMPAL